MSKVLSSVKAIKELVQRHYHKGEVQKCSDGLGKLSSDDLGEDVLLAFRHVMSGAVLEHEAQVKLLNFGADLAMYMVSDGVIGASRIPYEIIETFLDDRTVAEIDALWTSIEALLDKLMDPTIFAQKSAQNNLRVLKFCNKLIRRLSKTCHTELLGRVLFFLASIFPVSERSAVNSLGRVNTSNKTVLDTLAEFKANADPGTSAAGKGMDVDGEEGEVTDVGDSSNSNNSRKDKNKVTVDGIDFNVYETFWGLQNCLSVETRTMDSMGEWNKTMKHAKAVLTALEASSFSDLALKQEAAKWESARVAAELTGETGCGGGEQQQCHREAGTDSEGVYMGTKYLTSSKLLKLQIQDPLMRQQLCTQLLILSHHIRARPPVLVKPLEVNEDASEKVKKRQRIERKQKVRESWRKVRADLENLEKRAFAVVLSTPPNGKDLVATLQRLLEREQNWIRWKNFGGCESFEEPATKELGSDAISELAPRELPVVNEEEAAVKRAKYFKEVSDERANAVVDGLRASTTSYDDHMELYMDAENPQESGIEEQYHPKHDALYCWRARRLMAQQHLGVFEYMPDGNLSTGLQKIEALGRGEVLSRDLVFTIGDDESEEEAETAGDGDENDEEGYKSVDGDDETEEGEVQKNDDEDTLEKLTTSDETAATATAEAEKEASMDVDAIMAEVEAGTDAGTDGGEVKVVDHAEEEEKEKEKSTPPKRKGRKRKA
jgi:THO complex subunit 1